ncbi:MAG: helix-turn-helix domain-containing protein [Chloroflexi bacterium]|uniref:Helix-turn-helix domain-containing protein n=1 Tax=Candidatus Chlorohelix allophototropha TaxID=3003348 RepID=A0A8T7MAE0_9CHLR|nr:helix-turn-helix domain-containing protein [Chloroflexota bacterium]WJW70430.1 helix-turn-helix domain-containing protein [Chloroflexota bacterium L227-S17]
MELMNLKQACDYLGVTLVTLRKLINTGKLTAIPDELDSRQKLIKKSELDTFLAKRGGAEAYHPVSEELEGVLKAATESEAEKLIDTHTYMEDIKRMAAEILAQKEFNQRQRASA